MTSIFRLGYHNGQFLLTYQVCKFSNLVPMMLSAHPNGDGGGGVERVRFPVFVLLVRQANLEVLEMSALKLLLQLMERMEYLVLRTLMVLILIGISHGRQCR